MSKQRRSAHKETAAKDVSAHEAFQSSDNSYAAEIIGEQSIAAGDIDLPEMQYLQRVGEDLYGESQDMTMHERQGFLNDKAVEQKVGPESWEEMKDLPEDLREQYLNEKALRQDEDQQQSPAEATGGEPDESMDGAPDDTRGALGGMLLV